MMERMIDEPIEQEAVENISEDFSTPGIAGSLDSGEGLIFGSPYSETPSSGILDVSFPVPTGEDPGIWKPGEDFSMDNVGLITTGDWQGAGNLIPSGWVGEHYTGITGQNWDDEWDTLPNPYANFVVPELSEEDQSLVETADAYFVDLGKKSLAAGYDDPEDYLMVLAQTDPSGFEDEISRYNYFGEAWETHSNDYLTAKQSAMGAFYADPGFQAWLGSEDAQEWVNGISGTLGAVYGLSGDQAKHLMTGGLNDLLSDQGLMLATQEDVDADLAGYLGQVINIPNPTQPPTQPPTHPATQPPTQPPTLVENLAPILPANSVQGVFDAPDADFRSYMSDLFFADDSINEETDWNSVSYGDKTIALGSYVNEILGYDHGGGTTPSFADLFDDRTDAGTTPREYPRFIVNAMENGDEYISAAVGGDMYSWWDSLSDNDRHKVVSSLEDSDGISISPDHAMMEMVNVSDVNGDVFRLQSDGTVASVVPDFYIEELRESDTGYGALASAIDRSKYALSSWLSKGVAGRQNLWRINAANSGPVSMRVTYVQPAGETLVADSPIFEETSEPPAESDIEVVENQETVGNNPIGHTGSGFVGIEDHVATDYGSIPFAEMADTLDGDAGFISWDELEFIVDTAHPDTFSDLDRFDWEYYLERYPDLAEAGIADERSALTHYINGGHLRDGREGFEPVVDVDTGLGVIGLGGDNSQADEAESRNYADGVSREPPEDKGDIWGMFQYPDQIPGWNTEGGKKHYSVYEVPYYEEPILPSELTPKTGWGHWSGTPKSWPLGTPKTVSLHDGNFVYPDDSDKFDWVYYLNTNPDLLDAEGHTGLPAGIDNEGEAWQHFLLAGHAEGRAGHYKDPTPDVLDESGYVTVNGELLLDEYGPVTSSEMYYEPGRVLGEGPSEGASGYIGIDDREPGMGRWRNRVAGFGGLSPTPTPEDAALANEDRRRLAPVIPEPEPDLGSDLGPTWVEERNDNGDLIGLSYWPVQQTSPTLAGGGIVGQGIQGLVPAGSVPDSGGGYVGGYSGGMDDSIPAMTDGQSPAALSSGEFVVPADVVAHLGDGNTQNGSAKLSDMLDRIRSYKTGSTVQPGAINDEWVFPA